MAKKTKRASKKRNLIRKVSPGLAKMPGSFSDPRGKMAPPIIPKKTTPAFPGSLFPGQGMNLGQR